MTQKILIGKPTQTDEELYTLAIQLGCCAYYKGIPPCYKVISEEEGWVLPHVYIEEVPE